MDRQTGRAQVERVVEHLTSGGCGPEWPLATVAMDDPKFDAMQIWRGPIWVNINLLFVEALERAGKQKSRTSCGAAVTPT
ncbi:MAG: hypothetical protein IPK52_16245 [Chloroflexi bacterium]|nr:hypothetical protein [Chloroflexota bacterium]